MRATLKPIDQQTIVVTGATSGHGLATALQAAREGANVVLVARDEAALKEVCKNIAKQGGIAAYVVADVADADAIDKVVEATKERFGGFDTWVNNAGIGVYGKALETPIEDHRQVFETNYWGVVHGSLAAARHLRAKAEGGAIINVGSINGDMAGPLLSAYNASKHAVKGFTDSLRIEMLAESAPVSITLIKPSAIGTPFPEHGRNLTGSEAKLPPPIYDPQLVAGAILHAAQHHRRSITVGGAGKIQVLGATILPALYDKIASKMGPALVDKSKPVGMKKGNLYEPQGNDGRVDGRQQGRNFSLFTSVARRPALAAGTLALVSGAAWWAADRRAG
ncbi:SDR family oxidoreductase [Sphingomonas sp. LHG3406-1]|uniref:SDR family oxidoreductase n=1 Tax=Sphingomonas sp. LHG3406-1 TaxID=2804617 RepID=UPI00261B7836|nr:SDR family oxidoreductase [Sphingomonas sp. LHG3406-1]